MHSGGPLTKGVRLVSKPYPGTQFLKLDGGRVNEACGLTAVQATPIPIRAIGCMHNGSRPQLADQSDPLRPRFALTQVLRLVR